MVVMNNGQSIGILNQTQNKDHPHMQQLQLQQIQVQQKQQQQQQQFGLRAPFQQQQLQFQAAPNSGLIQTQQQQQQAVQNQLMQQQALAQLNSQQQQQQAAQNQQQQGQHLIINGQPNSGQPAQVLALSSSGTGNNNGAPNIQPKSAMIITAAHQGQGANGGGAGDRPIMTISNAAVQIVSATGQPLNNPLSSPQGPLQPPPNPLIAMTSLAVHPLQSSVTKEMTVTPVTTSGGAPVSASTTATVSSTETGKTTTTTTSAENKATEAARASESPVTSKPSAVTSTSSSTSTTTQSATVTGVTNGNISGNASTKLLLEKGGLPKAMVKPQVLTHVIEGFVIQESNEPFPVTRQRYPVTMENGDDEPPKKKMAQEAVVSGNGTSEGVSSGAVPGTDQMACEVCGKVELKAKMKKKRFCSVTCSKSAKAQGSSGGAEDGKGDDKNISLVGSDEVTKMDTSCDSATGSTTTTAPVVDEESCDIVKWTVTEVCDFIRNLPGCTDYVEDFETQEIDGQALLLLKENHLVNAMGMKLGPALKIVARVEALRAGSASVAAAEKANVSGSANDSTASVTTN